MKSKELAECGDGDPLDNGLVVSKPGDYLPVAVYRCACGREQSAECDTFPGKARGGGISTKLAEYFGWRKIDFVWHCPFCTGNTENLAACFKGE